MSGELADAETQLRRAVAAGERNIGVRYRQIAALNIRARNAAAAREWLEKGMAADPCDPWTRAEYAALLMNEKDFAGAARFADEALALATDNPGWFHRRRAEVELRRGDARRAEEILKLAAAEDMQDPWPHFDLAGLHLRQDKLDAAAAAAEAALARAPQNAKMTQRRAEVELRRGDREAALASYAKAAALDPHDPWIRLSLARLHADARRFDEATRELDAALAMQPGAESSFHRLRSEIEMSRGERALGLAAAQRAVRADPEDMWSHMHLSGVLLEIGDLDAAAQAASEAERLAPALSGHVYRRLAEIEGRRNNPAGAVSVLEKAVAAAPDDHWSWYALASHRLAMNDAAGAEAAAKVADAGLTGPGRAHALRLRSQIARRRDDVAAAAAYLREALQLAPDDPWSRLAAADHLFAEGDAGAALEMLKPALPPKAKANVHMLCRAAAFAERLKDFAAARGYLDAAAAAEPENPQPWSALANLLIAAGDLKGARAAAEKAVEIASKGREGAAQSERA